MVSVRINWAKFNLSFPLVGLLSLGVLLPSYVASVSVVAPALLGVVRSVRAPMFLAERAMLLYTALLGFFGVA